MSWNMTSIVYSHILLLVIIMLEEKEAAQRGNKPNQKLKTYLLLFFLFILNCIMKKVKRINQSCSAASTASGCSKCGMIMEAPAESRRSRFHASTPSPLFSSVATPTAYPPMAAVSSIST